MTSPKPRPTSVLLAAATMAGLVAPLAAPPAAARDITMGRVAEHAAIDPHFNNAGNDASTMRNIYDSLLNFDVNQAIGPSLAASWRVLDPLTWEIRLRDGVRFHDGSPFTAEDVVFSLTRAKDVPNSPSSWARNVGDIATMTVVDPLTIRITSAVPTPLLLEQIGQVYIASRRAAQGATTADFNSGRAAIGTGPMRFVSWTPGDQMRLTRFDGHWRGPSEFERVTVRFITNPAARLSSLLSGGVDIIDGVPPGDVARLERERGIRVTSIVTPRMAYMALDSARDESPFVTDAEGRPMARNPLRDPRVRQAMSMMINREALVNTLLSGGGVPAGQIVPVGQGGYDPALAPMPFDVARARALLAEAGWPNGFGLTIHSSNNRFPQDAAMAQALGQMLARGGIRVNGVTTMPFNVYIGQATDQRFSAFLFAYNSASPHSADGLRGLLATRDLSRGLGGTNRGRYSNAEFDAALARALAAFDEEERNRLLVEATRIAMADQGIIPLLWQKSFWASRGDIEHAANMLDETSVRFARVVR
jgi:peptide/nickel transport system substrate-binding protein